MNDKTELEKRLCMSAFRWRTLNLVCLVRSIRVMDVDVEIMGIMSGKVGANFS